MTDDHDTTDDGPDGQLDDHDTADDGPDGQLDDHDEPPADRPLDGATEEDAQSSPADPPGDGSASASDGEDGTTLTDGDADVRGYLLKGALVMLVVLGVVATLQFYLSAQTAIRRLASDEFRPVFVAAFNLVVLLAVGVGIAQVVRRLG